jgi:hypothetical protein
MTQYRKNIMHFATCGKKRQQMQASMNTINLSELMITQHELAE